MQNTPSSVTVSMSFTGTFTFRLPNQSDVSSGSTFNAENAYAFSSALTLGRYESIPPAAERRTAREENGTGISKSTPASNGTTASLSPI